VNTHNRQKSDSLGSNTRRFLREAWKRLREEARLDPGDGFSDCW
tara:strand:- start:241 stop:372 length:132 start_codon:yes stop_codon:yes gene_type:complete